MTNVLELGPQGEPLLTDARIMELMEDPFFKNNGRPVPQTPQHLGIGFGNLSGEVFGESQNSLEFGPQHEPILRFNDEHDPKTGQFTSGSGGAKDDDFASKLESALKDVSGKKPAEKEKGTSDKKEKDSAVEKTLSLLGLTLGKEYSADQVVSTPGNKQAYDVLKNRGGMDATFTLKEIPVGKPEPSNSTTKEKVKDYKERPTAAPPIIVYENEVIDGNHRLAAAKQRGDKTILAFVGYKNEDAERSLCPQSEALRFNDEHDPKTGEFTSGGGGSKESQWESSGTKVSGDVKTTTYTGKNQTIVVEHNTKEGKVTVKRLDSNGDLLVQTAHDSIGSARKELQSQGIDHKFYATRSEQRYDLEPERDDSGKYSMGTVAKFEHEDGRIAFVTKHNGKFHVNVLKNGLPHLPGAMYEDQEVATTKAAELLKRSVADEDGAWVTVNGAHVFIKNGVIEKGPAEFIGKTASDMTKAKSAEKELTPMQQKLEEGIRAVAEKQGLTGDKLIVSFGSKEVSIGNEFEHFNQVAGMANLQTGQVTIFANAVTTSSLPGVLAHEIEHTKFERVYGQYQKEQDALNRLSLTDAAKYESVTKVVDGVHRIDTSNDAAVAMFPVASRLEKYLSDQDNVSKMIEADGCTAYSRAHWDSYKETYDIKLAYHETLAEISRLKEEGKAGGGVIDRQWLALHSWVNVLAEEVKK